MSIFPSCIVGGVHGYENTLQNILSFSNMLKIFT